MDQVKFFKGCLPQILLSPFMNTLTFMLLLTFELPVLRIDCDIDEKGFKLPVVYFQSVLEMFKKKRKATDNWKWLF